MYPSQQGGRGRGHHPGDTITIIGTKATAECHLVLSLPVHLHINPYIAIDTRIILFTFI